MNSIAEQKPQNKITSTMSGLLITYITSIAQINYSGALKVADGYYSVGSYCSFAIFLFRI